MTLHYGSLEETDIPAALKTADMCGGSFEMMQTSFFLSRQTLIASKNPGMALWREKLFAWMLRNAATAMEFFKLPTNRVVELGSQVNWLPSPRGGGISRRALRSWLPATRATLNRGGGLPPCPGPPSQAMAPRSSSGLGKVTEAQRHEHP